MARTAIIAAVTTRVFYQRSLIEKAVGLSRRSGLPAPYGGFGAPRPPQYVKVLLGVFRESQYAVAAEEQRPVEALPRVVVPGLVGRSEPDMFERERDLATLLELLG